MVYRSRKGVWLISTYEELSLIINAIIMICAIRAFDKRKNNHPTDQSFVIIFSKIFYNGINKAANHLGRLLFISLSEIYLY